MNDQDQFQGFDFSEKQLLYRGLLAMVESNQGFGFANSDQGHPAYRIGTSGNFDYDQWGDSPDHNRLFKMMHSLSIDLSEAELDRSSEIGTYVFSWSDFCGIATTAYDAKNNQRG